MNFAHFDRFFVLAAAGLGLVLAGGLNLALGSTGRRAWLRVPATVALGGAVVAGLAFLARPELAAKAAGVLAAVLAGTFLLGSDWLARRVAAAVAFFRRPAVRWGLVGLGGLAVVVGSGIAFDADDRAESDQTLAEFELLSARPPERRAEAGAATDRGAPVVLKEAIQPRPDAELLEPEEKILRNTRHANRVIRRADATDKSNCHGWVFTGGKFLLSPDAVALILKDNGYAEVQEPQPGDLVVYRTGGEIAHTAVVRYVAEGQSVLVEGKWGSLGVFLHPAEGSCYGTEFTFHRSPRQGHLLAGLGGSPAPAGTPPLATE
jgi:hypothetical protein